MPNIYFDTEFEGLFDTAGLISIGLTNETGSSLFYAELTDTYSLDNCSEFCKKTVIPLLEHNNLMSLSELKVNLKKWLESQGENTILVCDSPRDITQIDFLFSEGLPKNCQIKVLGFYAKWYRRFSNLGRHLYTKHELRDHHALDDAIINRIIFEKQ